MDAGAKGGSSAHKQLAIPGYVQRQIPEGTPTWPVGDSEFGAVEVIGQMEALHCMYVARQKASHLLWLTGGTHWQAFAVRWLDHQQDTVH